MADIKYFYCKYYLFVDVGVGYASRVAVTVILLFIYFA